jgi:ATP-dependent Clp protease ATP-binding subunit ClpB
MSEFQDQRSVNRFIGDPEGNMSGLLTEAVKNRPFSLILLDEFEKAHPAVLNLFLAILDEGRARDNLGQVIDFKNTIIIATSNALSDYIKSELDKGTDFNLLSKEIKNKLTAVFRPELLNRFNEVVVFKPLSPENIVSISRLQLSKLTQRLLEKGIILSFEESAITKIAQLGYHPTFGARPLSSVINHFIVEPLSQMMLVDKIKNRDRITVAYENNRFEFRLSRAAVI